MSELVLFVIACFFIFVLTYIYSRGFSKDKKENECRPIYKTDAAGEFGTGWTNFTVCPNCGVAVLHSMEKKSVKINCPECEHEMTLNKTRKEIEDELQQKKL